MMARLRGALFLAYQVLITPFYAFAMLATFWLPPVRATGWPRTGAACRCSARG